MFRCPGRVRAPDTEQEYTTAGREADVGILPLPQGRNPAVRVKGTRMETGHPRSTVKVNRMCPPPACASPVALSYLQLSESHLHVDKGGTGMRLIFCGWEGVVEEGWSHAVARLAATLVSESQGS